MNYEEGDDTLDHVEARGDMVVLMGSEVVARNAAGDWQLTVRTITAIVPARARGPLGLMWQLVHTTARSDSLVSAGW